MDPNPSTLNFTQNSIATSIGSDPHQCNPTLLPDPNDPNDVKFTENKLLFDSLNNVLDQLIDGGNSSNLVTEISETTTSNATVLKNNLLQNSPYLSNEVIKAFANRTDIYTNQDVYDVIVQNPEEARRLETFLLEKEIPFTDAMMDDLSTATLAVSSARGEQEAAQHFYYKKMMTAANAILFDLKTNSPTGNFVEVNQWITNKENQLPFYGLIELQIREGNYTVAQSMINTVPLDYNLSVAQQLEYDNFVLLKSHQMDVYGNGDTWAALSTEQEDDLVAIANNNEGWTGKQARHILNHYFGYHYPLTPPSVGGDGDTPDSPYISQPNNQFNPSKQLVTATPNPASEDVFFNFRNLDYQMSNQLYIKDLNGNLIKIFTLEGDNGNVQWSTNNLSSGIYIYYIEIDGKVEAIQKLVLIK